MACYEVTFTFNILYLFVCFWRDSPQWTRASSFTRFLDHTQRSTTVGRTPLDEWSACRRDLYLTTHSTHNRQISLPPVGFEPTISAGEWPQTHALDRSATGTGLTYVLYIVIRFECTCIGSHWRCFRRNISHLHYGDERRDLSVCRLNIKVTDVFYLFIYLFIYSFIHSYLLYLSFIGAYSFCGTHIKSTPFSCLSTRVPLWNGLEDFHEI